METKELLKGLRFEGYYDEQGIYCVEIDQNNATELIKRITGAKEVEIKC